MKQKKDRSCNDGSFLICYYLMPIMPKKSENFIAKIVNSDNGQFILSLDKTQKIKIAQKFLPNEIKIGDEIILEFYSRAQFNARQKNLAEAVLKEILGE
ncbi:MAG: hypothetical protein CEN89_248 [Candidatus Berkelbacteria bacterium Licking1014_7]|uniref:DUF3006 domain-containing protein n=1 Tax=Candidatus Berkelbacteria bacterium Licking1014_7 TaxID=2017147 RepID=A0A554LJT3_9BACT|nr:MAG: hypothetical protein CEN89_248 [Candidatus Berkelbacteria bacterium Licking1014_7]